MRASLSARHSDPPPPSPPLQQPRIIVHHGIFLSVGFFYSCCSVDAYLICEPREHRYGSSKLGKSIIQSPQSVSHSIVSSLPGPSICSTPCSPPTGKSSPASAWCPSLPSPPPSFLPLAHHVHPHPPSPEVFWPGSLILEGGARVDGALDCLHTGHAPLNQPAPLPSPRNTPCPPQPAPPAPGSLLASDLFLLSRLLLPTRASALLTPGPCDHRGTLSESIPPHRCPPPGTHVHARLLEHAAISTTDTQSRPKSCCD